MNIWTDPLYYPTYDPSEASLVKSLVADVKNPNKYTGFTHQFYYVVPPEQPTVSVIPHWGADGALGRALSAVPLPDVYSTSHDTDKALFIGQQDPDGVVRRYWEFWQLTQAADGSYHCEWGGYSEHYDTTPGYFSPAEYPGAGWNWGTSATHMMIAPALIKPEEVLAGHIPHALRLCLPDVLPGQWSFPAQATDGTAGKIPYGARFRLLKHYDISYLTPNQQVIARAWQEYGMYAAERTHASVSLDLQGNIGSGPTWADIWGEDQHKMLMGLPWDQLRVCTLDMRSTPGPASV